MPQDNHPFIGAMDLDSPDNDVAPGFHRSARNIIFRGVGNKMRAESVNGFLPVTNPNLPNSGVNRCIGSFYDPVNQNIFDFNFNSGGTHGIYIYNTLIQTWQTIIQTGTNTIGDPLGFTATGTIQGVCIIYVDLNRGDLLYYVDSLRRPSKINIQRFLNTPYTNIIRTYLNVIKAPPSVPPRVTYEHDTTVNANNLTNSLFQFGESFIYDDNEESVVSPGSITPLPTVPFSNISNVPVSKNSRISIYLQTGDQNVSKIRIYMRQTQNGVQSGWFIVDTISKVNGSIPNNSIYRYAFYNNANYVPADPKFTVLLYDWTPRFTNCQELLNGNTLSYGGIREGRDYIKSAFSNTSVNTFVPYRINGFLFFADFDGTITAGQPTVKIVLTGAGSNDVNNNAAVLDFYANHYFLNATSNGSDISFQSGGNGAVITNTLTQIKTDAISAGWTFVSQDANSLRIYYPTGTIALKSTYTTGYNPLNLSNIMTNALFPESGYSYGVVYYDSDGKTNNVITDVTANVTSLPNINFLGIGAVTNLTINLAGITPPTWAVYYHLVRTNTLTFGKYTDWISSQAFSNVKEQIVTKYAWIGISNMIDYNQEMQATQNVVSYEFTQGDRIRFRARYDILGNYFAANFDYPILGLDTNPVVNGTQQTGTFVKIAYPTADISATFAFDNSDNFQNYQITLYSITSNASPQTENISGSTVGEGNVFYEDGFEFGIGNAGLNTAYHYGNVMDNQIALSDGDIFFRQRTVPTGNTYYITVNYSAFSNRYATPLMPDPLISNAQYTIGPQNGLAASLAFNQYPTIGDGGGFYVNNSGATQTVRIRGIAEVVSAGGTYSDIYVKVDTGANSGTLVTVVRQSSPIVAVPSGPFEINIDATFGVPPGAKAWIIFGNGTQVVNLIYNPFTLRVDVIKNIPIMVFDKSFSDIYQLATNSNSRPNIQDTTAKDTYFSTLFRWSENYQLGTNINNTNRFYPNNFDEFDKSFGDIMRMTIFGRQLTIWQKRKCGLINIFAKFIKDNNGTNTLVTTDAIITPNNIEYYEGDYGIGNQVNGIGVAGFQRYFPDPVKGYFCRLSKDGIQPISLINRIQTFAGVNITKYLNDYNYPYGGVAQILGVYNIPQDRDSEMIFVLQSGSNTSTTIGGESVAFSEEGNKWTSFYDYSWDSVISVENSLYSFLNGVMYKQLSSATPCNFADVQQKPQITIIKNSMPTVKKTWQGISEVSNVKWNSPLIYTDVNSYPDQRQESNIVDGDLNLIEGQYSTRFMRDINSIGGVGNGQQLKGTLIVIEFTVTDGSKFSYLNDVPVKFIPSPVLVR